MVFEPAALRLLVDVLGDDRVLLGSDYPYPLGERPVGEVVREADFLTDGQRDKLLSGNALRFLGRGMTEDRSVLSRTADAGHGPCLRQPGGPGGGRLVRRPGRALVVLLHGGFWRPEFDRRHLRPMAVALGTSAIRWQRSSTGVSPAGRT